jgi:hypothetical protein
MKETGCNRSFLEFSLVTFCVQEKESDKPPVKRLKIKQRLRIAA